MRSTRRCTLLATTVAGALIAGLATAAGATAAVPDATAAPDATATTHGAPVPRVGSPFPFVGLVRTAGADRYETAALIAEASFQPSADPAETAASAVFITSGEAPADALSAGPAAAGLEAPLLLTRPDALPEATAVELQRLRPASVYVVGGRERVSDAALAAIAAASPGAEVQRIAGATRYETAVQIAEEFFPDADGVVLTRGDTFPDALSGGAAAAAAGVPLLITEPAALPAPVTTWLAGKSFDATLVVGGTSSVSDAVAATLASHVSDPTAATRIAGGDRYETAAAVATEVFPDAGTVFLATGDDFPDALAGVPAAAVNAAPVLLLPRQCYPTSVGTYLLSGTISTEVILGGPASVTPQALSDECA
ncbi:hypothetical protein GTQ99_02720 [Kineococcus sp. T13]|uniref:cell wall-binding repeat-containing protein n=1 Tax=Kineococcus vitellinus TaxID=2696565 RepID=UPI0014121FB2|nr:cell wall-binding repeat-containing protein [Kineococcus vitellinus]NAZ74339.1 hypothetical protein [Kineococcus vitellinus]